MTRYKLFFGYVGFSDELILRSKRSSLMSVKFMSEKLHYWFNQLLVQSQ